MYRILDRLKGDFWALRGMGTDLLILGLHSMDAIQAGQNRRVAALQRAFVARLAAASAARDIHRPSSAPRAMRPPVAHASARARSLLWSVFPSDRPTPRPSAPMESVKSGPAHSVNENEEIRTQSHRWPERCLTP